MLEVPEAELWRFVRKILEILEFYQRSPPAYGNSIKRRVKQSQSDVLKQIHTNDDK